MGGTADKFVPCIQKNTGDFSCRALNENEPKAKFKFSANGTCALSEVESKTKSEVSAAGTCRILNENEPKAKFEFSANGTCALSEVESKTKGEVSAAGRCRAEQKMKGKER